MVCQTVCELPWPPLLPSDHFTLATLLTSFTFAGLVHSWVFCAFSLFLSFPLSFPFPFSFSFLFPFSFPFLFSFLPFPSLFFEIISTHKKFQIGYLKNLYDFIPDFSHINILYNIALHYQSHKINIDTVPLTNCRLYSDFSNSTHPPSSDPASNLEFHAAFSCLVYLILFSLK